MGIFIPFTPDVFYAIKTLLQKENNNKKKDPSRSVLERIAVGAPALAMAQSVHDECS